MHNKDWCWRVECEDASDHGAGAVQQLSEPSSDGACQECADAEVYGPTAFSCSSACQDSD